MGGHPVYSLWTEPGIGYRTRPGAAKGVAVGDQPESMYMVTSGEHYNDHCCFVRANAAFGTSRLPSQLQLDLESVWALVSRLLCRSLFALCLLGHAQASLMVEIVGCA